MSAVSYWSMVFEGKAKSLSEARRFAVKALGDCSGVDLVELVVSELAGNAIQHSGSGLPGGRFAVHLAVFRDRWQVRVDDEGGLSTPLVGQADEVEDEAGRGLALVAAVSSSWGVLGNHYGRAVWAEILMPDEVRHG